MLVAAAGSELAGVARRNRLASGKGRVRVEMFKQHNNKLEPLDRHLQYRYNSSPSGVVYRYTNNTTTTTTTSSLHPSPARRSVVLTRPPQQHRILCAHPSRVSLPPHSHPSPNAYFFSITLIARALHLLRTIQDSLRFHLKALPRSNASPLAAGGGAFDH